MFLDVQDHLALILKIRPEVMTVSRVRIITDSFGIRTFRIAEGSISIQVIEAIVCVGELEERHVVVNSYPVPLDSASREYIIRVIMAQVGSQTVSLLQEDGPGYTWVAPAGDQSLSAIGVAAAVEQR